MYFIYVLKNSQGKWYIGQTSDLQLRLQKHNENMVKSTKNKGPWVLAYYEELNSRSEAMRREEYLKSGRGRIFLKVKIK